MDCTDILAPAIPSGAEPKPPFHHLLYSPPPTYLDMAASSFPSSFSPSYPQTTKHRSAINHAHTREIFTYSIKFFTLSASLPLPSPEVLLY